MINVEITERSIRLSGHACRKASDGIDRACAAVSALTCSLINSLQDLTHDRVQAMAEAVQDASTGYAANCLFCER